MLEVVDHVVTPEMNQHLLQPYTLEKVKSTLFKMHPSKSLETDGMSPFLVGVDVTNVVLSVLHFGHFLCKMNYTHIVLIPKRNEPQYMSDFSPHQLSKRDLQNCF